MDKIWYYMKPNRRKYGPYDDQELIALITKEILLADDFIWMPDLKDWIKVGDSIYAFFLPDNQPTIENTFS
ncbi:MAG: DUF4339 domain-containing protein [Erysipelotrichaceae bacterium]|nr:DUF4339 domain-containing protein [Erysipelotrichaceae bacterium]